MANLVTVSPKIWTDELYMLAPGAIPATLDQILTTTLREFCRRSHAWVCEVWDKDTDNGDVPKPFNFGHDVPFYDFQALLETARDAATPPYVSGSASTALTQYYTLEDFWPWDILSVRMASYFDKYAWDPDATLRPQIVTRFVYPTATPLNRAPVRPVTTSEGWPSQFNSYNERPGAIQLLPSIGDGIDDGEGIVPWIAFGFPSELIAVDAVPSVFETQWYDYILDGAASKLLMQQDKPYTNPVLAQYHGRRFRIGIAEARDAASKQQSPAESQWRFPRWA